jgi:gluconate 2-dehydrogenase gamma chain
MIDRRRFLTILGAAVAARAVAPGARPALAAEMRGMSPAGERAYTYFTDPEVEFVKAAVARLIPADELGPGAAEAGVPYFIDQQLAGAYGAAAHFYGQGPFGSETPFQGYQLPLSPAELYRVGIAATDQYCRETHGKRFAELDPAAQDAVLSGLEGIAAAVDLKEVPGTAFFTALLGDTKDGFFADPAYGGDRNMAGWKLVGFPGVVPGYSTAIGEHNKPYPAAPRALHSLQQADLSPDLHRPPRRRRADAVAPALPTSPQAPREVAQDWVSGQRIFV